MSTRAADQPVVPRHLAKDLTPRELGSLSPLQAKERREDKQRRARDANTTAFAAMKPHQRAKLEREVFSPRVGTPIKHATVYVTKETRVVSGGLPTLGKRQ